MDTTGGVDVERARIARRSLLKKAAIAGAVAWTAPVVLESVTNPAGALTCAPGNYCWPAGATIAVTGTDPEVLRIVSGALGTTAITVQPNYTNVTNTVCAGDPGIHWGSPNAPSGYLVVNVTCTG